MIDLAKQIWHLGAMLVWLFLQENWKACLGLVVAIVSVVLIGIGIQARNDRHEENHVVKVVPRLPENFARWYVERSIETDALVSKEVAQKLYDSVLTSPEMYENSRRHHVGVTTNRSQTNAEA